jgi:hypothetical protein
MSLIALGLDVFEKNTHLENFTGVLSTFISTSFVFWNIIFAGLFLYFIPLIILTLIGSLYKDAFFKYEFVSRIYNILEKCPLLIVNTINALVGSLLALSVLMLFTDKPFVNSISLIIVAGVVYIFSVINISILIDIRNRINSNRVYF